MADGIALDGVAEHDDQFGFLRQLLAQRFHRAQFFAGFRDQAGDGKFALPHRAAGHRVGVGGVMAEVGADLEGEKRMLFGQVRADDQRRLGGVDVGHGCQRGGLAADGVQQRGKVTAAVMIDVGRT